MCRFGLRFGLTGSFVEICSRSCCCLDRFPHAHHGLPGSAVVEWGSSLVLPFQAVLRRWPGSTGPLLAFAGPSLCVVKNMFKDVHVNAHNIHRTLVIKLNMSIRKSWRDYVRQEIAKGGGKFFAYITYHEEALLSTERSKHMDPGQSPGNFLAGQVSK